MVDGIDGKRTLAAQQDFREDNGMPALGDELEEVLIGAVFHSKFKKKQQIVENQPAKWYGIKYFKRSEFACKCGKCGGFPAEPSLELARVLDKLREHFGNPAHINSGVRCKAHNKAVGGASNSQHLYGTAADIATIEGTTPAEMYAYAEKLLPNTGGIGIYNWGIHIDVRKQKARF
jgi:hypothetical protein